MSYISKWRLQNNSVVPVGSNLFGTCNSGSSDTTKVVSLSAFNVLVEGVTIHVYFANANSGSNTLLQVGSTSAQPIKRNGVAEGKWESGSVISFTYSQGYWVQNDADVGGGVAETYTLSKNGDTITLTGSGGDTSSVTDDDTTYTFSISGHTLTITPSNGTPQTITLPDDDTTYTISGSGNTITLTGSDGSTSSATVQGGGGSGTPIPTADEVAEFDSTAHMNSTDMTTGADSELEDFIDGLNVNGNNKESATATKVGSYYSSGTITAYKCCGCVTVKLDGLALSTLSARTTVATLPAGFRPSVEVYSIIHGTTRGILVTSSGNVQIESGSSGTYWASITYSAWN